MKKKKIVVLILLILSVEINAQSFQKTMKRLPDTGQNTSYTSIFGEDSDYLLNTPFFTLNGDGTVTDTITGLMWQKTDGGEMTVENAALYTASLTLANYTDWRLPNCHELISILNLDKSNPAHDTIYFTKTLAEYWWSSQSQINDVSKRWCLNSGGGIGNHAKTETMSAGGVKRFHVRAVRDINTPVILQNHFLNNGNGTTTDLVTNLMWKQLPSSDSLTWDQALAFSESLVFSGYSDWRLPNIKELQSINDEGIINPSVSQTYFSGVTTSKYWSSTSLPNQITKAWHLNTQFGITSYDEKIRKLYFLCVRNGNITTSNSELWFSNQDVDLLINPISKIITIQSEKKINQILITDLLGQTIFQIKTDQKQIQLDKYGVYCVTLFYDNVIFTKKIVFFDN